MYFWIYNTALLLSTKLPTWTVVETGGGIPQDSSRYFSVVFRRADNTVAFWIWHAAFRAIRTAGYHAEAGVETAAQGILEQLCY